MLGYIIHLKWKSSCFQGRPLKVSNHSSTLVWIEPTWAPVAAQDRTPFPSGLLCCLAFIAVLLVFPLLFQGWTRPPLTPCWMVASPWAEKWPGKKRSIMAHQMSSRHHALRNLRIWVLHSASQNSCARVPLSTRSFSRISLLQVSAPAPCVSQVPGEVDSYPRMKPAELRIWHDWFKETPHVSWEKRNGFVWSIFPDFPWLFFSQIEREIFWESHQLGIKDCTTLGDSMIPTTSLEADIPSGKLT